MTQTKFPCDLSDFLIFFDKPEEWPQDVAKLRLEKQTYENEASGPDRVLHSPFQILSSCSCNQFTDSTEHTARERWMRERDREEDERKYERGRGELSQYDRDWWQIGQWEKAYSGGSERGSNPQKWGEGRRLRERWRGEGRKERWHDTKRQRNLPWRPFSRTKCHLLTVPTPIWLIGCKLLSNKWYSLLRNPPYQLKKHSSRRGNVSHLHRLLVGFAEVSFLTLPVWQKEVPLFRWWQSGTPLLLLGPTTALCGLTSSRAAT